MSELKDVAATVLYLAVSLSIMQTYKSLILLQQGINEFGPNYLFAIVEALALGKIVVLAEKLPLLKRSGRHALAMEVLFQSLMMTLIADAAVKIEDTLFPMAAKLLEHSGSPLIFLLNRQVALMSLFIVLFTVRGLDELLGPGKLWKLIFQPPGTGTNNT